MTKQPLKKKKSETVNCLRKNCLNNEEVQKQPKQYWDLFTHKVNYWYTYSHQISIAKKENSHTQPKVNSPPPPPPPPFHLSLPKKKKNHWFDKNMLKVNGPTKTEICSNKKLNWNFKKTVSMWVCSQSQWVYTLCKNAFLYILLE